MKAIWPELIIFSVDQASLSTHDNIPSRIDVFQTFGDNVITGSGFVDGQHEVSFLTSADNEEMVAKICEKYNQTCYLFIFNDRTVQLKSGGKETDTKLPGYFQSVPFAEIDGLDAWSEFREQYFSVLEREPR